MHIINSLIAQESFSFQKNPNPYLINHFRPLSLCNASYKIISNILVNRIRPLMNDDLISPLQIAFVPKRLISDNISLAHELQIQKM